MSTSFSLFQFYAFVLLRRSVLGAGTTTYAWTLLLAPVLVPVPQLMPGRYEDRYMYECTCTYTYTSPPLLARTLHPKPSTLNRAQCTWALALARTCTGCVPTCAYTCTRVQPGWSCTCTCTYTSPPLAALNLLCLRLYLYVCLYLCPKSVQVQVPPRYGYRYVPTPPG